MIIIQFSKTSTKRDSFFSQKNLNPRHNFSIWIPNEIFRQSLSIPMYIIYYACMGSYIKKENILFTWMNTYISGCTRDYSSLVDLSQACMHIISSIEELQLHSHASHSSGHYTPSNNNNRLHNLMLIFLREIWDLLLNLTRLSLLVFANLETWREAITFQTTGNIQEHSLSP